MNAIFANRGNVASIVVRKTITDIIIAAANANFVVFIFAVTSFFMLSNGMKSLNCF